MVKYLRRNFLFSNIILSVETNSEPLFEIITSHIKLPQIRNFQPSQNIVKLHYEEVNSIFDIPIDKELQLLTPSHVPPFLALSNHPAQGFTYVDLPPLNDNIFLLSWLLGPRIKVDFVNQSITGWVPLNFSSSISEPSLLDCILFRPLKFLLAIHGLFSVHAAILKKGTTGILVCGGSGTGKSSIAMSLISGGYTLLADDRAFIKRENKKIWVYPLLGKLKLKTKVALLFKELRPVLKISKPLKNEVELSVRVIFEQKSINRCIAKIVLFPSYTQNKRIKLEKIPRKEAMDILIEENLSGTGSQFKKDALAEYFVTIVSLVSQTDTYRLYYNDGELCNIPHAIEKLRLA